MSKTLITTATLAVLALGAPLARAGAVQADVSFVAAFPVGNYETGDYADEVFDAGVGVLSDVLLGINDNFLIGGGVGYYRNGGGYFAINPGGFEEHVVYHLTSVPVHALVLWRASQPDGLGYYVEGGLGATYHHLDVEHNHDYDGSQTSFSYILGAGLSYPVSHRWDLTGGVAFHQAITSSDGDVWFEGDNPQTVLLTIGLRWHRE